MTLKWSSFGRSQRFSPFLVGPRPTPTLHSTSLSRLQGKGNVFFWDLFCGEPRYGANVSDQPRHAADVQGGGGGDLLEWEEGGQITATCEKCRLDERTKGKRRPAVSKIQNSRSKEKGFRTHLKLNLKKMSTYLKKLSF